MASTLGKGSDDQLTGTRQDDDIRGLKGNDTVDGMGGDDVIRGNAGNDLMRGGAGSDTAYGGHGDDRLVGYTGADSLLGGAGNDTINGGAGNDTLIGGGGPDTLIGGTGADTFVFSANDADGSRDTIKDFDALQGDTIDLSGLNATTSVDQIGDQLTGHPGQIAIHANGPGHGSLILFDKDGDGTADLTISVPGTVDPHELVI